MLVLVLNGPINAGKTTTGKALAAILPDAAFFDGDDHDAPDDAPLDRRIEAALQRMEALIASTMAAVLILAFPLRSADYVRLKLACTSRAAELCVVTLAPSIEIATRNRGTRELGPDEIARSRQMYAEGYASRDFSDLTICEMTTPEATARHICRDLGLS